jgi:ribose 5-phosphate isomerase A
VDNPLAALAAKALEFVPNGAVIGLGSGHAAEAFVEALAARVRQGLVVRCVATSEATARLAQSLGLALEPLGEAPMAVTIDGADEVEVGSLNAIKGWGGALARERVTAAASLEQILLITSEKLVDRLGSRGKLPVEVLPFAAQFVRRKLEDLPL